MVFFNYATMEMSAKIVYYGPGLCGKTTNLKWIFNQMPQVRRGEMVSLATETDRTLFFDLLPLRLGKVGDFSTRIQLYTVPGQVFYNSTRKLVLKGVDGVVFVADSQEPMLDANIESLENLQENLAEQKLYLRKLPWVIQYNKRDLPGILPIDNLNRHLNFMDVPYYESVATQGIGVMDTLVGIANLTLKHLRKKAGEDVLDDEEAFILFEEELMNALTGKGTDQRETPTELSNKTPMTPPISQGSKDQKPITIVSKPGKDLADIRSESPALKVATPKLSTPEDSISARVSDSSMKKASIQSSKHDDQVPMKSEDLPEHGDGKSTIRSDVVPRINLSIQRPSTLDMIDEAGMVDGADAEGLVIDKEVTQKIRIPIKVIKDQEVSQVNLKLKLEIECVLVSEIHKKEDVTAEKLAAKALEDFLLGKSKRKKP